MQPARVQGGPKSGADAVIAAEEEEDRQHAASLEMHREISNLRAQLTDARARLFAAGIPAFPGPSTPVARYGTGSAVEAPEAPRITVEPECPVSEGGAETTGQPAAAPRDSTPDKAHGVSEIMAEGQSTEQPKEQNRSVGLWGFITGSDKKPE